MQINEALLEKLEKLSSFKISDEKREEILEQLSKVVSFVEILNELDLENEKATFTTAKGGTLMREDKPQNNEEIIKIILQNAPSSNDNFFVVPKIIE